jgi:hypothetical protein
MVHDREDIRVQSMRKLTVEFVEDSPKAVVAGDELTVTNSGELPRMKSTEFAELRSPGPILLVGVAFRVRWSRWCAWHG